MSVAEVAIPASARRFAAVAAANTLIYAGYALLWFGSAYGVFMVVGRRALGEGSPVLSAATTVALYALRVCIFLLPVSLLLVTARSVASLSNKAKEHTKEPAVKGTRQIFRKVVREMLQDAVMVGLLATFPFLLLLGAGSLVMGMSPVKESQREIIGSILVDVGILGANAMHCFVILPITILRIWRMKY
ncbi:hypothetical protein ACQ4PT_046027 [Festuca glaucescens]